MRRVGGWPVRTAPNQRIAAPTAATQPVLVSDPLIERADYVALTGDRRVNDASIWLAPGASAATAMEALRRLPGGERLRLPERRDDA